MYLEGETQEPGFGHEDEENTNRWHMHRFWLLDLATLEGQDLPWLENPTPFLRRTDTEFFSRIRPRALTEPPFCR
jgi:hypothetical protein